MRKSALAAKKSSCATVGDPRLTERIAAVRRFNRFYTQHLGVLQEGWLNSPFSLTEARVLYEIFRRGRATATEVGEALGLDAGYLSRIVKRFDKRGLIHRENSRDDARQSFLSLTSRGHGAYAPLEQHTVTEIGATLANLPDIAQTHLLDAMRFIETSLNRKRTDAGDADPKPAYVLREPKPGDFGWIVSRHAELYAQEYGWREPFEGLCAQIVADFANNFDPKRERCWIAEMNGENVGCVMLVRETEEIARLRLLLVDPSARGLGLGARLTDECVRFAREAGYRQITLWTHSVLTAARHIYEKAGFTLTSSEPRKSWGQDVVAEFWDLKL
jgi:DNA-binding MarR family transcriptional regulator/GNAT superfamily N-acetyltransferase